MARKTERAAFSIPKRAAERAKREAEKAKLKVRGVSRGRKLVAQLELYEGMAGAQGK
jgi:hypothetical protein